MWCSLLCSCHHEITSPGESRFSSASATSSLLSFSHRKGGQTLEFSILWPLHQACKQISGKALTKQPTTKSHSQECIYMWRIHIIISLVLFSENQKYTGLPHLEISLEASSLRNCSGLQTALEANEAYLFSIFEDAYLCVIHIKI